VAERTFVAHSDIPFGGVLAYSRGQTVTEQAVTDNGWQDYVHAAGTKAAAEIQAEITGRDASEFQTTTTRSAKSTSSDSASTTEQKG
jgi:xanthine dehydrogenase iron-sulfur cluster and FAD-binding subunit A